MDAKVEGCYGVERCGGYGGYGVERYGGYGVEVGPEGRGGSEAGEIGNSRLPCVRIPFART